MTKTSIHFKPAKVGSIEAHNERTRAYLDGVLKSGRQFYFFKDLSHLNKSIVNPSYKGMTCAEIFERQKEQYKLKTGQKPNLEDRVITNQKTGKTRTISGWSPIREGVVPIKEDTKLEDFKPFIDWCADNGLKVIRIDLHFDEGYENSKGDRSFNRHAHIVVDWLNWATGKTAKLDASKMSEAQDIIAESLGMERGEKKLESGKEHLAPAQFREKKAEEYAILLEEENQRLKKENDTLKSVNTGLKAKIQDAWQYKGRTEAAESLLEAEKTAHKEDMKRMEAEVANFKKMAEISEKRANDAELAISHYRSENAILQKENKRLTVVANHWERKYQELIHPDDPKKGLSIQK